MSQHQTIQQTARLRLADSTDCTALQQLLTDCAEALSHQGMDHWLGFYDLQQVQANLDNKQVYVLEQQQRLLGCIAISREPADYYADCWPEVSRADAYLTQMAVDPACQGQGLGRQLLEFAMQQAAANTIQLDAVSYYQRLQQFYLAAGFRIIARGHALGASRCLFQWSATQA